MLTRRQLIAATAALALPAPRVWAQSTLMLGEVRIDTLSDGSLTLPGSFILGGLPEDEVAAILAQHGLSAEVLTPPCNVTLLRDGQNTVLFDAGSGPDFQPTAGKLVEALEVVGLTVEDVTHLVLTHAHPDHLWGLLDEFDEPLFANAELSIGAGEFDYWTDPATVTSIDAARQTFAVGAARRLELVADRLRLLADGDQPVAGVTAVATPGHTPGHLAFRVEVAGGAMILGDAIGNHHVALARPDWPTGSDQDAAMAAETRLRLLDQIAADALPVVGFHLPEGGIGRIERDGAAYRLISTL